MEEVTAWERDLVGAGQGWLGTEARGGAQKERNLQTDFTFCCPPYLLLHLIPARTLLHLSQ